ncbi:hypothetical protein [Sphingomonas paucimobilis]|uniref:hypothetical protein n=1 Tax=Sphingomonas paucimobilis TaxID=13689 RepID=UPI00160245A3|nr:hypothetical protein [Sphingomonas paucimobilis]
MAPQRVATFEVVRKLSSAISVFLHGLAIAYSPRIITAAANNDMPMVVKIIRQNGRLSALFALIYIPSAIVGVVVMGMLGWKTLVIPVARNAAVPQRNGDLCRFTLRFGCNRVTSGTLVGDRGGHRFRDLLPNVVAHPDARGDGNGGASGAFSKHGPQCDDHAGSPPDDPSATACHHLKRSTGPAPFMSAYRLPNSAQQAISIVVLSYAATDTEIRGVDSTAFPGPCGETSHSSCPDVIFRPQHQRILADYEMTTHISGTHDRANADIFDMPVIQNMEYRRIRYYLALTVVDICTVAASFFVVNKLYIGDWLASHGVTMMSVIIPTFLALLVLTAPIVIPRSATRASARSRPYALWSRSCGDADRCLFFQGRREFLARDFLSGTFCSITLLIVERLFVGRMILRRLNDQVFSQIVLVDNISGSRATG